MKRHSLILDGPKLEESVNVRVRFSEVDSLGIVWHGNYLKYFEDAREAFGRKFGLGYLQVYEQGYAIPLIDVQANFKKIVKYGDEILVKAIFQDSLAAKIIFRFEIRDPKTNDLIAEGSSTQIFIDRDSEDLCLTLPDFYTNWKKKWGLIK
ncbi:MAG: acyl-CoA thioesterase [Bacteroidales bacterium]